MASSRRATTLMALAAALVLIATTTVGAVAAEDTTAKNVEPKVPEYRTWRIYEVPKDGVLAFDCAGDVPTLRAVPRSGSAEHVVDAGNTPASTCGGPGSGTPTQYKYSRVGKPDTRYSALYWAAPGGEDEEAAGLLPVPKIQLMAIPKAVAAVMEALWKEESGEAMPESVPFPADTVVFYNKEWLVTMGREDVEFRQPPGLIEGKAHHLTLGEVM